MRKPTGKRAHVAVPRPIAVSLGVKVQIKSTRRATWTAIGETLGTSGSPAPAADHNLRVRVSSATLPFKPNHAVETLSVILHVGVAGAEAPLHTALSSS